MTAESSVIHPQVTRFFKATDVTDDRLKFLERLFGRGRIIITRQKLFNERIQCLESLGMISGMHYSIHKTKVWTELFGTVHGIEILVECPVRFRVVGRRGQNRNRVEIEGGSLA